jgi:hypothetical protein
MLHQRKKALVNQAPSTHDPSGHTGGEYCNPEPLTARRHKPYQRH